MSVGCTGCDGHNCIRKTEQPPKKTPCNTTRPVEPTKISQVAQVPNNDDPGGIGSAK